MLPCSESRVSFTVHYETPILTLLVTQVRPEGLVHVIPTMYNYTALLHEERRHFLVTFRIVLPNLDLCIRDRRNRTLCTLYILWSTLWLVASQQKRNKYYSEYLWYNYSTSTRWYPGNVLPGTSTTIYSELGDWHRRG